MSVVGVDPPTAFHRRRLNTLPVGPGPALTQASTPPVHGVVSSRASTTELPRWLPRFIARLNELLSLESGWDGRSAPDIQPWAVEAAIKAVGSLPVEIAEPNVVPTPVGGLQLEWQHGPFDIEVEVSPDGTSVEAYVVDTRNGADDFGELLAMLPRLSSILTS